MRQKRYILSWPLVDKVNDKIVFVYKKPAICKPQHWNLGIGIGIGTDITNHYFQFHKPMDPKLSRLVT